MLRQAIVAIAFLAAAAAHAQDRGEIVLLREGEPLDPALVMRILGGEVAAPAVKLRSIRMLHQRAGAANTRPSTEGGGEGSRGGTPSALALPVQFAFDSSEILPEARTQLDQLAEGLRGLPVSHRVVIEGHTDAAGGEGYNLGLSQRRAEAVKRYLVLFHGFEANRFRTVGLGETQLLNEADPQAAENRRVQFRAG